MWTTWCVGENGGTRQVGGARKSRRLDQDKLDARIWLWSLWTVMLTAKSVLVFFKDKKNHVKCFILYVLGPKLLGFRYCMFIIVCPIVRAGMPSFKMGRSVVVLVIVGTNCLVTAWTCLHARWHIHCPSFACLGRHKTCFIALWIVLFVYYSICGGNC